MLKGEERKDVLGVRVAEVLEADPPSDQPIIKRLFFFQILKLYRMVSR